MKNNNIGILVYKSIYYLDNMNLIIVLLGCNIFQILQDRIDTMMEFTEKNLVKNLVSYPLQITVFLSGGIKNNYKKIKSEASVMKSLIDDNINLKFINKNQTYQTHQNHQNLHNDQNNFKNIKWNFILDEESTNTAENFVRASKYLNSTNIKYDDIYVVTSEFHKPRAKLMVELVDSSREYKWILGKYSLRDSQYMETIHIKNVYSDIDKALKSIGV